jgi:HK97 gp10 family phage protein
LVDRNTGGKLVIDFDDAEIAALANALRVNGPKQLNKAFRAAANRAGTLLVKAVKAKIPKASAKKLPIPGGQGKALIAGKTGLLKKSIIKKVVTNRRGRTILIVGPNKDKTVDAYSPWLKRMITVRASRYAHLVELGFVQKIRGRTKRIPAKPFFRPAMDESRAAIIEITAKSLALSLEKIFQKQSGKSRKKAA